VGTFFPQGVSAEDALTTHITAQMTCQTERLPDKPESCTESLLATPEPGCLFRSPMWPNDLLDHCTTAVILEFSGFALDKIRFGMY
jgi:hypothetical protein